LPKKILFLIACFFACQREATIDRSEIIFGSYFRVKASGDKRILNKAISEVFSQMRQYNDLFSVFFPNSEVSQLNRSGRIRGSPDLIAVIKIAEEISDLTDGAFDITIRPLLELWGFYKREYRLPQEKEINEIRGSVDYQKIKVEKDSVYLPPGMEIDLGGIAVGYAIDRAYEVLKKWGIKKGLIDGGGDILVFGEEVFKIGIKDPRKEGIVETLNLRNQAVSTSGDYENYFEVKGRRFSHILDPKTGYPKEGVWSVTVIGEKATICDALSTALFVLGERGEAYKKNFPGYRAIVYLAGGKRLEW